MGYPAKTENDHSDSVPQTGTDCTRSADVVQLQDGNDLATVPLTKPQSFKRYPVALVQALAAFVDVAIIFLVCWLLLPEGGATLLITAAATALAFVGAKAFFNGYPGDKVA